MPPINPTYLDCVIYIYKNKRDAKDGIAAGGSGFLVSIPFEINHDLSALYAVTNNHVINNCPETVAIRLNTRDGKTDIIETAPSDWKRHNEGADVRAIQVKLGGSQFVTDQLRAIGFLLGNWLMS